MKKFITAYVRFLQQILLFVSLFIAYFIFVGFTRLLIFVLRPKMLYDSPGFFQKPETQTDLVKPY
jgi:hypothetical protein